jgi:hypothetical protein
MSRPERERTIVPEEVPPLSPNGNGHLSTRDPLPETRLPEPRLPEPKPIEARATEPGTAAAQAVPARPITPEPARAKAEPASSAPEAGNGKERLDFLLRPRTNRPASQSAEAFDAMWPKRGGSSRSPLEVSRAESPRAEVGARAALAEATVSAESRRSAPQVAVAPAPAPVAVEEQQQRSVAILKSGVVDGMAYTLYADGSIEAQLPQGTVRFGSIAELRAHIENHS